MTKKMLFLIFTLFTFQSTAAINVMFHPHDPSLTKISNYILQATESIDLALYNIDSSSKNPVVQTLASDEIQEKIKSEQLRVRLIFEGYESKESNQKKMKLFESLGVDARFMGMSRKMHHKFAVIDSQTLNPTLITGSANWSMASKKNYNENILYLENKPGITRSFQNHFDLLWSKAKEFGFSKEYQNISQKELPLESGLQVHFNTANFKTTPTGFRVRKDVPGFALTRKIVELIDQAKDHIEIATTRIKLRPIYEAIKNAAARGVKVDILVTMGQYEYAYKRKRAKLKKCEDIYEKKCSTSQNFALFLNKYKYKGKKNVTVRIKYFDVRKASYLQKQMHSKYIITDKKNLITGSFNWSVSAEYNHFENIISVDGHIHPEVMQSYLDDFKSMWEMNRGSYDSLISTLEVNSMKQEKFKCGFNPMALTYSEIDYLLNSGRRMGTALSRLCM